MQTNGETAGGWSWQEKEVGMNRGTGHRGTRDKKG
jgi:hypothetical protein